MSGYLLGLPDGTTIQSLYDQHALTIYKVICCHVRNNTEADRILEKTFQNFVTNLPHFESHKKGALISLAGIARCLACQSSSF